MPLAMGKVVDMFYFPIHLPCRIGVLFGHELFEFLALCLTYRPVYFL